MCSQPKQLDRKGDLAVGCSDAKKKNRAVDSSPLTSDFLERARRGISKE